MAELVGKYDIICIQGATFSKEIQYKDATGTAIDLTGYTAKMQVRPKHKDPKVLLELSSTGDSPRITITGATGTIALLVSATDTAKLEFTDAVYDLEITSAGGQVTRLLEGKFTMSPEVTK